MVVEARGVNTGAGGVPKVGVPVVPVPNGAGVGAGAAPKLGAGVGVVPKVVGVAPKGVGAVPKGTGVAPVGVGGAPKVEGGGGELTPNPPGAGGEAPKASCTVVLPAPLGAAVAGAEV